MNWRSIHKWLSVLIGVQVLVWVLSGLVISLLDHDLVDARTGFVATPSAGNIRIEGPLFEPRQLPLPDHSVPNTIVVKRVLDQLSYVVHTSDAKFVFNAYTGEPLSVSEEQAKSLASKSYAGKAEINSGNYLPEGLAQLKKRVGATPQWEIGFADDYNTFVYVSATDGQVLAHRNRYTRLVDFLLMLHFMDYAQAGSFNNWQIRIVSLLSLWLAISGLLLVKTSLVPSGRLKSKRT